MSRRFPLLAVLTAAAATAAVAAPGAASASTTWLCKPGLASNPCAPGLATTTISPTGQTLGTVTPAKTKNPKIDCFYVYPTVSNQPGPQATKRIDPEERSIALYQVARYSQYCRIYAPMYRQVTLEGLGIAGSGVSSTTKPNFALPVRDVENAFEDRDIL